MADRRPTARLRPDNAPVRAAGLRRAGVRVVELADVDALCLRLDPGTVPFGWEVEAQRLTAQAGPRRWSWESGSPAGRSGRGSGTLVVPLGGCVEVAASVRLHGPGGVAGDWAVHRAYGSDCTRAPRARHILW